MPQMIRLLALVLLWVPTLDASANKEEFSEAPFKVEAIEPVRALVEAVGFNNWMRENFARMGPGQAQGAREHLHALVDSRVKQAYASGKTLLPATTDPTLALLYSWAGRLGVYGADAVYARVRGGLPITPPAGPSPPANFTLSLKGETLVLSSLTGEWQATVPYHFFIFAIQDAEGVDKRRTEMAITSTGTAPDAAPPGYSQATLALVFVQGADRATFETEWAERLEIPTSAVPTAVEGTGYRSRSAYDPKTRLHRELVVVPSEKGSFAVFYSGLDGTYQANRPHFLDFIRMVKLPQ